MFSIGEAASGETTPPPTANTRHFVLDNSADASLLRRAAAGGHRSKSGSANTSLNLSDYPTAAERAERRARLAASGGPSEVAALKRELGEKEEELAFANKRIADEEAYSARLAEENDRLRRDADNAKKAAVGTGSAELVELRGQLAVRDERIKALQRKLERAEAARRVAEEGMQRALKAARAESKERAMPDESLVAVNEKLRAQLVTEKFRELVIGSRDSDENLDVLRAACPNVSDAVLSKALRNAKGDLKTAMIHLQANHRVSSSSTASSSSSSGVGSCGMSSRSSKEGAAADTTAAGSAAAAAAAAGGDGRDKIVIVSTRCGSKLGLKFKTVAGVGGEAHSGDDGLEISEVVPGHAADKSGEIAVGDVIVKINSESLCGVPMSRVRRMLRGAETFKITLRAPPSQGGGGGGARGGRALPKPESVEGADPEMAKIILSEVVDNTHVEMSDVIGLKKAKQSLTEIVIFPSLYPEMFTGLRKPCKGLLLFGPPGNGKTLLAKAIASTAQSTFFAISASSLTSKWVGQSEKLVRALFACGRATQPSIIFIDEVDSILSERRSGGQEGSQRLKTEFLVSFDGVAAGGAERVLVMAATNLPWEIDSAAMRRLPKRVHIPMPNEFARHDLIRLMLKKGAEDGTASEITADQVTQIVAATDGYSNSDLASLVREAAAEPMREFMQSAPIEEMVAARNAGRAPSLRPIRLQDFLEAAKTIKPSYGPETLAKYKAWAEQYGTEDTQQKVEELDE